MKGLIFILANVLLLKVAAQIPPRGQADYEMIVTLDVERKILDGKTTVTWKNPSDKTVDELQFHLYYNAFKNSESTFMKNGRDFGFLMKSLEEECGWAYSEITSFLDADGRDLLGSSAYISPDDGNVEDQTVLMIPLITPVEPGESVAFQFAWTAKIPKAMIRTGYNKDYFFFAQWFPKLGVYEAAGMRYEEEGAWNCHQYHASGEYYGEFGNYEVSLEVPEDYVVGASGSLRSSETIGSMKRWNFAVDSVIDFSWTCSPHYEVVEDQWNDVKLMLYTYPGHEHFAPRYFASAKNALEYMAEHVGSYDYSTLSMVDPPIHGLFTGGMEYPTFISSISANFFPPGVKAPETLVVHEFVHQYFMQLIATHEQEEPWMDEGITSYYEGRILDEYYGARTSMLDVAGLQLGNKEYNRYEFWSSPNPKIADNSYKARDFIHGGYGTIAYNKTAMMLRTLEGILGQEELDQVMKKYFETWKYNHPCGEDFTSIFYQELDSAYLAEKKLDLVQFFKQALYGSVICEYTIQSVENTSKLRSGGYLSTTDDCVQYSEKEGSQRSKVVLERLGEMILPVEVLLEFKGGDSELHTWDGAQRSTEILVSGREVVKVSLDPDHKLDLEKNKLDNTWLAKPSSAYKKYTSRFKVGMQHFLDLLNLLS